MTDKDELIFRDILQKTFYFNRKPTKRRLTGRDRYIKYDLDNDVRRILISDTKLKGRGNEKIVKPSNLFDIYTRLEVLLGLKLSSYTDTHSELSKLRHDLYKRGERQNEQQYRNALNKFSNIYTYNYKISLLSK